jgi:hypothetical protein
MRPVVAILALTLAAVALGGCGITDPYQPTTKSTNSPPAPATSASAAADRGDPAPERGGTIPPSAQAAQNKLTAHAGSPTPQAALERYATLYINWTAGDVIAVQRRLASISLGHARALALQAIASASHDRILSQSQVANSGQLVSLAPGQPAAAGRWVLVTSEHTTGQRDYSGLPPTLHVTYATVTHTSRGWVVSQWQPQT